MRAAERSLQIFLPSFPSLYDSTPILVITRLIALPFCFLRIRNKALSAAGWSLILRGQMLHLGPP
jgi:hypothetical protein